VNTFNQRELATEIELANGVTIIVAAKTNTIMAITVAIIMKTDIHVIPTETVNGMIGIIAAKESVENPHVHVKILEVEIIV
jgi:tRNA A37 threonylcarbamoyladenosine synthetase subunit TsaC/SUA5/YrdC